MHFISTNGIWPQIQQSPFQLKTSALEEREKMAFQDLQMNVVSLNERHTTKLSPENPSGYRSVRWQSWKSAQLGATISKENGAMQVGVRKKEMVSVNLLPLRCVFIRPWQQFS
jgi:hypothetical protein